MNELTYERDLLNMKFAILKSTHIEEIVKVIASFIGIPTQKLRKILIYQLDMMSLEALADRYASWEKFGDKDDPTKALIGYELFTRYIPLVTPGTMETIYQRAVEQVNGQVLIRIEPGTETCTGTEFLKSLLREAIER